MALKLTINEPLELALTRPDPKLYQHGNKAPSYMYSVVLSDSREDKLFATPELKETIEQLQIKPRQPFTLCQRKSPNGKVYFEVNTQRSSQQSNAIQPKPGARESQAQPAEPPRRRVSMGFIMSAAMIAAIDAKIAGEEHARKKGVKIEFAASDIRAIADTMFIAASRDPLFAERLDRVA